VQGALYARVSTSRQEQEQNLASQVAALRTCAAARGYAVAAAHVYLDDGNSGARLDRPGLDRLRDAAQAGLVERCWPRLAPSASGSTCRRSARCSRLCWSGRCRSRRASAGTGPRSRGRAGGGAAGDRGGGQHGYVGPARGAGASSRASAMACSGERACPAAQPAANAAGSRPARAAATCRSKAARPVASMSGLTAGNRAAAAPKSRPAGAACPLRGGQAGQPGQAQRGAVQARQLPPQA